MARLKFGGEKKSRFPYWVIPTVIFVFGVGMLVGRGMESDLTLAELREGNLTVSEMLERLWPKKREAARPVVVRNAVQQTETENRLKSENTRLMTEKDALVQQVQAVKTELKGREESIKGLRAEINKLAQSNPELIELSKEHQKFREQVAVQTAAPRREAAPIQPAAAPRPAARPSPRLAPKPTQPVAAAKTVVKPTVVRSQPQIYRGPSYQIVRRTPILRNPSDNAQILSYLSPGRKVQVGGIVNGRFMRLQYSRSGIPPGYVLATDVTPLQ